MFSSSKQPLFGNVSNTSLTEAKAVKNKAKRKMLFSKRQQNFADIFEDVEAGESLHIISNGNFGNTECLAHLCEVYKPEFVSCTTWTFNDDFIAFMGDQDCKVSLLVDKSIKTRKGPKLGMLEQKRVNNNNINIKLVDGIHAKIGLIKSKNNYIVIEASANYCMNVRIEQFVITNDKALFEFHKGWIEGL